MRLAAFLAATVAALALTACSQPAEAPTDAPAAPQEVETPSSVPTPPASQTPTGAEPRACDAEIGRAAADRLVERCRMLSPATRPPCNVANPCEMIRNEIDRSCALYGPDEEKPGECAA